MVDDTLLIQRIKADVSKAYTSLDHHNYKFVSKALADQPYDQLTQLLACLGDVFEEDTDINEDVSFGYRICDGQDCIFFQLSMVGPYAVVQRILPDGTTQVVVQASCNTPFERSVIDAIAAAGIVVLDEQVLSFPLREQFGDLESGVATVYRLLFTDTDLLPWQYVPD
jgi:hypothetical protein